MKINSRPAKFGSKNSDFSAVLKLQIASWAKTYA
ncbi:hypothetical protein BH23BAC1_BH23BAC1_48910 [soil metagenome]